MALPTREPVVGETASVSVECTDCGHTRWLRPEELAVFGVASSTPLTQLAARLSCSACRLDGLPGKSIALQAAFSTDKARMNAERWRGARSPAAHAAGLRARSV